LPETWREKSASRDNAKLRVSVLDLGSTSFHLLVSDASASAGLGRVTRERIQLRLGAFLNRAASIPEETCARAIEAARALKTTSDASRPDRLLVVALKHHRGADAEAPAFSERAITQPAFLIGKVLDALILDQLEVELHRLQVVNALLAEGVAVYGESFLGRVSGAVRAQRGAGYRIVETRVVRPSQDIGRLAAQCYRTHGAGSLGALPSLLTRMALRGVPENEADLLSYIFFDKRFTAELVALGREDARRQEDEIVRLLTS